MLGVVLIVLLLSPAVAEEPETGTKDDLIGIHRDEVVVMMGEPDKVKKRRDGQVLVYEGLAMWTVHAEDDDPGCELAQVHGATKNEKIRIFLDREGRVTKIKVGKRVIEYKNHRSPPTRLPYQLQIPSG